MNIKKHIPNVLTLINLLSGCLLVYFTLLSSFTEQHETSDLINIIVILFSISLLADLLDGMVARWLNVASPIGLQLDSLADLITFGLFPGFLMTSMISEYASDNNHDINYPPIAFFGLFITLMSAYRLAKFNVDLTQASYFKGLAVPANAIFIFGVYNLLPFLPSVLDTDYILYFLILISIISGILLVSNIPLFAFKFKSFELKSILPQVIFVSISMILLIIYGLLSLSLIIILYIIISIIFKKTITHA